MPIESKANLSLRSNPALYQNRKAWDERARGGGWYVDTATEKDFEFPLSVVDPRGWLAGGVAGLRLLCLAAGGGRHGPLFAAAGAAVTVVDLSPAMLELDRQVAFQRGVNLRLVEASMDDLSQLEDASFDAVFQPVSTCYIPRAELVFQEVARVVKCGGLYLSQHKQPAGLQAEADWNSQVEGYVVGRPAISGAIVPDPCVAVAHRESGTVEFLHRLQDLLGGICQAGFVIEDFAEPRRESPNAPPGSFEHRSFFLPPFLAIKARRTAAAPASSPVSKLWIPGVA